MNCKNCNSALQPKSNFCHVCGGKVVTERISTKVLIADFMANYIGWDNRFFVTLRSLILMPYDVLTSYLEGVRSRYMPPIVFIGIGVALATIVYNSYSEEYLDITQSLNNTQFEMIHKNYENGNISKENYQYQIDNLENTKETQKTILKYFNIFSFISLPFYALISLLVFGRKYTYGEHLVINCYLQGLSFFGGILFFLVGIYIWKPLFLFQLVFIIPYYLWTYAKLMDFGFGKAVLKLLLFLAILIGFMLAFIIIVAAVVILSKFVFS